MIARTIWIHGRVQGVGFREWTVSVAHGLGARGWVRNRGDGRVEIYVLGDAAVVDRLCLQIRIGPPAARVGRVAVEHARLAPVEDFARRPTA